MEKNQNNTEEHVHGPECNHDHDHEGHDHAPAAPGNPFANLSEDIQRKIQELQMMEQSFQQLLMQKNTFSMEINEEYSVVPTLVETACDGVPPKAGKINNRLITKRSGNIFTKVNIF